MRDLSPSPLILLIENDAANRTLAEIILARAGFRLRSAPDGQTALSYLDDADFNLILTDISMPGLDGYHLARLIRQRPAYAQVPLVAITAHAHPSEAERARAAGFAEVLVKPYRREQLVALVERCLALGVRP